MQDTAPHEHPTGEPAGDEPPAIRGRRLRRLGVLAVVASFIGIWGYIMYLSVQGRAEPRDRLDDTTWTAAAEAACAPAQQAIDRLPYANELHTPAERAEMLDVATSQLDAMVARLEALAPPANPDEARAVERWLADYREYLRNRRAYAERFREGLDEPFRVTDRGGFQIDVLLDDFAHINYMDSCMTPEDVG